MLWIVNSNLPFFFFQLLKQNFENGPVCQKVAQHFRSFVKWIAFVKTTRLHKNNILLPHKTHTFHMTSIFLNQLHTAVADQKHF